MAQPASDVRVGAGHARQPRVRRGALAGGSTPSTPSPATCCGSSSAEAATTQARARYSVDGRQYVAVPTGFGGWAEGFLPAMLGSRHGSALFAFALPE